MNMSDNRMTHTKTKANKMIDCVTFEHNTLKSLIID